MSKTNDLTKQVITLLALHGFHVWRQNNIAIKGRKFIGKKGVPDIIGYEKKTGIFIGVEIKAGKDKLSAEQIEFHQAMREAGAFIFVARDSRAFLTELVNEKKARTQKNTPDK